MNAKELLAKNDNLHKWWSSVVGDGRFDQVMMILKANSFEGNPTPDQQSGITQFISSMESIVNPDEAPTVYANPGLNHDLDVHRRLAEQTPPDSTPPEPTKPKKKK